MKALVDGDILLYSIGSATDDEGNPLSWPLTFARLKGKIDQIVRESEADTYAVYITGDNNFRDVEATIKPYKGNRNQPKPHHYQKIKDFFKTTKDMEVVWCDGYEADDGMAMKQYEVFEEIWEDGILVDCIPTGEFREIEPLKTIICSKDKDLDMVPGWHYKWHDGGKKKNESYLVTITDGWRWFFKQLLMGDTTDNILGLYNVGKSSSLVKQIDGMNHPLEMYTHEHKQYEKRFGSYWKLFMHENARLLWMLRYEDDDIRDMLDGWEKER
jgi:hypothetical protein